MRSLLTLVLLFASLASAQTPPPPAPVGAARGGRGNQFAGMKRIRALIVSGGCCHDYRGQDKIMMDIMANVLPVDWTVLYEGGTSGDAKVALYNEPNWTKGFDVVVHNECYANVADEKFIRQITEAHKAGVPSMVIHCSLHSYRAATVDDWREFMGATSRRHTAAHKIEVKVTDPENNITKAIPAGWTTPTDELYVIEKLWPNAKALATAVSPEEGNSVYPVVWTNEYGGARVFATTLGHGETWNEPAFRELLVRGLRWTIKNE